jgi:hypothetical protein
LFSGYLPERRVTFPAVNIKRCSLERWVGQTAV